MSDGSRIEWTDATWSPVTGCSRVSDGCLNCYIERTPPFRMARRVFRVPTHQPDCATLTASNWDRMQQTIECSCPSSHEIGATTGVTLHSDRLGQPLRWRKPRMIFVCSMADLFHDDVPDGYIAQVFAMMAATPQHTYQVLTKRHGRMRSLLSSHEFDVAVAEAWCALGTRSGATDDDHTPPYPLPNVHLGVSAENQQWADIRIPALLETPAAVRWVSAEPLLGPIDLHANDDGMHNWLPDFGPVYDDPDEPICQAHGIPECGQGCRFIDWVVAGGESGPGARPMHPRWARDLRDQCQAAGVPFLFKQWGEWAPAPWKAPDGATHAFTGTMYRDARRGGDLVHHFMELDHKPTSIERADTTPAGAQGMRRVGKKTAGRVLDGRTWDEYPLGGQR